MQHERVAAGYPFYFFCAGLAFLLMAFLLPGHYSPWPAFEQEASAALGILCMAAIVPSAQFNTLKIPWLSVAALAVSIVPVVQWSVGKIAFLSDALLSALYLALFSLSILVGAAMRTIPRITVNTLFDGLLIAGVASCGIAAAQWLGTSSGIFVVALAAGSRPYANLAQPNLFCTLCALGVVAALHSYERHRISRGLAAVAIAWLGLGMVMSQSRAGWVFVLLLAAHWLALKRSAGLRLSGVALLIGVCAFSIAVIMWPQLNDWLLLSPSNNLGERLRTRNGWLRWTHWQTLLDAIWRAPWFGYGWGQVTLAQQATVLDHPATGEWLTNGHNLVVDLLVWNGVPLGVSLFAVLVYWFGRHVRLCDSSEQWTLLAGVGIVFAHAMLEYPLNYAFFLIPVGIMMGALDRLDVTGMKLNIPRGLFALLWSTIFIVAVWAGIEYLQLQSAVRNQRFVLLRIDHQPMAPAPDVVLLDAPRELYRFWTVDPSRGMATEQIDWMRRVSKRNAVPPAMLQFALATGLNGRPDEARDTLRKLCKMHPIERCEEGAKAWQELGQQYPELRAIEFPPVPPELIALRPSR